MLSQKEKMLPLVLTIFSIICSISTIYMIVTHGTLSGSILKANYDLLENAGITRRLEAVLATQIIFYRISVLLSIIFLGLAYKYKPGWLFIPALILSILSFAMFIHAT